MRTATIRLSALPHMLASTNRGDFRKQYPLLYVLHRLASSRCEGNLAGFVPGKLPQFPQMQLGRRKVVGQFAEHMDVGKGRRGLIHLYLILIDAGLVYRECLS